MTDLRTAAQQALEALEFSTLDAFMLAPISPGRESTIKAITALRAALAKPVQEPVAWLYEAGTDRTLHWYKPPLHGTPLYTAPPQRKPLTEEELSKIINNEIGFNSCVGWEEDFARAIERAHGIGDNNESA